MPAGRPTDYREEYAELALNYCLLGATDKELAGYFEVCERTIDAWKKTHPEFLRSIIEGRDVADAKVANALYQRALGSKDVPSDTKAASLWLRNRQPRKWRDKKELEHQGQAGGPPIVVISGIDASPPGSKVGDDGAD